MKMPAKDYPISHAVMKKSSRQARAFEIDCRIGFRLHQKSKGWNTEFSEEDWERISRLVKGKVHPLHESMTKSDAHFYFILNIESTVFGWHQINLWKEAFCPSKSMVNEQFHEWTKCLDTLQAALIPDTYYMLPMCIASGGNEKLRNAHEGLQAIRQGIELRRNSISSKGTNPMTARKLLARWLAGHLERHGIKPTTSEGGIFIELMEIVLSQQKADDNPNSVERLVKETVAQHKKNPDQGLMYIPMLSEI